MTATTTTAPLTFTEICHAHPEAAIALLLAERWAGTDPLTASRVSEAYLAKLAAAGHPAMKDPTLATTIRKHVNRAALGVDATPSPMKRIRMTSTFASPERRLCNGDTYTLERNDADSLIAAGVAVMV